jgi:phi13 family phage major tail protein
MAKIGLKYPVFKSDTTQGVIGKAIQADISITTNDAKLYADDGIAEIDNSFQSGTITLGIDDLSDEIQEALFGHAVSDGELTASGEDVSPYVGVGFYGKKVVSGVKKWRAIWLHKVKFSEPEDTNATKGESVEFGTATTEGTIVLDDNGDWKSEKTFDNEADAIAYLNDKAGIPVEESGGLTGLSLTGTGGTLSPTFSAGVRYYSFGTVSATSVTVTATAAGHNIKLYVDGAFSQTLTSGAASAAIPVSSGTKKLTIVAQEPGKKSQTTEVIVIK